MSLFPDSLHPFLSLLGHSAREKRPFLRAWPEILLLLLSFFLSLGKWHFALREKFWHATF